MPNLTTIIGPPGTGKTTHLARQVSRAVEKFGRDQVIVSSLTRTAAHEIASRGLDVDPQHVGTLHSICYRALGSPPLVHKTVAGFNETYRLNLSAGAAGGEVDDLDERSERSGADELLEAMTLYRVRCVDRSLWRSDVLAFADKWDAWKGATGTVDFTDMIEHALTRLPEGPHGPCSALFYDEAQDGSRLELRLLDQWARHADHSIIVGDDDQNLYSWRGASVKAFREWSERKITLSQSHRLPRAVHSAAQRWVAQIQYREPKEYAPRDADGSVTEADHSARWPETLLDEIAEHTSAGRDVMVLTSCGYMLTPLLKELRSTGTPFHNPFRIKRGDWNPLRISPRRPTPASRVLAFSRTSRDTWNGAARLWTWEELSSWAEHLKAATSLRHGGKAALKSEPATAGRTPTLEELERIFQPEALAAALTGDLGWYISATLESHRKPLEFPAAVLRKHGPRAVEESPHLVVGTIHSVKGGQADVVYLFPDLSPSAWSELDGDNPDSVYRTYYVGLTRARESVVLCSPCSGMAVDWSVIDAEGCTS